MSINGGEETGIEVPDQYSGQALLDLLKPLPKKEGPQLRVAKKVGEDGSAVIRGGLAVYRRRNKNAGGVRRGEVDISLVSSKRWNPKAVENRIVDSEES